MTTSDRNEYEHGDRFEEQRTCLKLGCNTPQSVWGLCPLHHQQEANELLERAKRSAENLSRRILKRDRFEELPVVDRRCDCENCEARTKETYRLGWVCSNCSQNFVLLIRKGDKPGNPGCPTCGITCYGGNKGLAERI